MAIPIYTAPSREEVEAGGRVLLQNFIREQFEHEGLSDDVSEYPQAQGDVAPPATNGNVPSPEDYGDSHPPKRSGTYTLTFLSSIPQDCQNEQWRQHGKVLKEVADKFEASPERKRVKQQADQVDIAHINQESFFNMLEEIFSDGVNQHRIVALFFFCSDILIRCVKEMPYTYAPTLFSWCIKYLVDRVCKWVYEHGGWGRVFSDFYDVLLKVSIIVALGVFITCGVVYIRRNW